MFSRTAKSVVKSLGQCSYHVAEENLKAIGAAGELGQTLSQFLKNGSKLESLAVIEVGQITKSAQKGFSLPESKDLNNYRETMPELTQTRFKFNSESKSSDPSRNSSQGQKGPSLEAKNEQSEHLIDVLKKLPIAEESENTNNLQMVPYSLQDGRNFASNVCATSLNRGEMGPSRFWSNKKKLKKYCQLQKLKEIQKCTKSFKNFMCGKKHHLISKRKSPIKMLSIFSERSPLSLNSYCKRNYYNFQFFPNNQLTVMNKRTIISTLSSQNQFFRFISTNKANCSKKKSYKDKIVEYCKKMRGMRGLDSKGKADPCKSAFKQESPKANECGKIGRSSCTSSNREHPCKKRKKELAEAKAKKESEKKIDPCKKETAKKIDPCRKDSAKKIDPCKKESAKKIDPCKKETENKIDLCKKETAKKIDPCKKESAKKTDPCKKKTAKIIYPCKKESTKKIDPCRKESTKKIDPCKKERAKKIDPCKKETAKKIDLCKKESTKKIDSCKKETDKKIDPCKKETAKKIDLCKKETAKKIDPCRKESAKKIDPCKKESEKKIDPCKKETAKKIDPCKKETAKKIDPCKKETAKKIDLCKKESTKKIDPCKKESTKKIDPCKKGSKTKVDPCKKVMPKLDDPCKKRDSNQKSDFKSKECPGVKKIQPCKKKECPPVFRAPECPSKKKDLNKKDPNKKC